MVPKIEDGNNFGVGIQVVFHCLKGGEYKSIQSLVMYISFDLQETIFPFQILHWRLRSQNCSTINPNRTAIAYIVRLCLNHLLDTPTRKKYHCPHTCTYALGSTHGLIAKVHRWKRYWTCQSYALNVKVTLKHHYPHMYALVHMGWYLKYNRWKRCQCYALNVKVNTWNYIVWRLFPNLVSVWQFLAFKWLSSYIQCWALAHVCMWGTNSVMCSARPSAIFLYCNINGWIIHHDRRRF